MTSALENSKAGNRWSGVGSGPTVVSSGEIMKVTPKERAEGSEQVLHAFIWGNECSRQKDQQGPRSWGMSMFIMSKERQEVKNAWSGVREIVTEGKLKS